MLCYDNFDWERQVHLVKDKRRGHHGDSLTDDGYSKDKMRIVLEVLADLKEDG
jgi:hypothetical protein